jgi:hypothetical protein
MKCDKFYAAMVFVGVYAVTIAMLLYLNVGV